jgi:hypothetical protein
MQVSGPSSVLDAGFACGVKFNLHNGLLDLQLEPRLVPDMLEFLRTQIKILVRKDTATAHDFVCVHRMSRMCFELATDAKLSGIDKLEGELLYEAPMNEKFEWVFKILNPIRNRLRSTECSIVVADHVAKNIDDIMTS